MLYKVMHTPNGTNKTKTLQVFITREAAEEWVRRAPHGLRRCGTLQIFEIEDAEHLGMWCVEYSFTSPVYKEFTKLRDYFYTEERANYREYDLQSAAQMLGIKDFTVTTYKI